MDAFIHQNATYLYYIPNGKNVQSNVKLHFMLKLYNFNHVQIEGLADF